MQYDLFTLLVYPVLFILPAWVANGAPVLFGGGKPLDFGRRIGGKPIFGRHKTIKGLVTGLSAGFVVAGAVSIAYPELLATGVALTIGTHFGDLFGSFVKRRLNKKEGASWALFDQYLFLGFGLLFALPFILSTQISLAGILVIIVLTGVLHKATNMIAHKAKIKDVPW
jgi:CDP-2,3-bis-(O-geranylgeranyl)-sn-glycerol synthase